MVENDEFTAALKMARATQAAQLEALLSVQDAAVLRLENLRDEVLHRLAGNDKAKDLFELSVHPGIRPKLWIDLHSSVVMEPDPRTYRLVEDNDAGKETVFETAHLKEMVEYIIRFLAHRVVTKEKALATVSTSTPVAPKGYSVADMIYVWLTGCIFGVMALLIAAMYLGKLQF
jgi:hypothetical protein